MIKDRASEIVTGLIKQAITELTCNTENEDEFEDALQELVVGLLMYADSESVLVIEEIEGGGTVGDLFEDGSWMDQYEDEDDDEDDFFGGPNLDREIL